jgi:hypothetical protein
MERLLIELLKELLMYIRDNYPACYGDVQIKIGDRRFFMVIKEDENLTLRSFIFGHYQKGKELNLESDYYIFTDYSTVKIIKKEHWIDYRNAEYKSNLVLTMNDGSEIFVVDKEILLKNDAVT